MKTISDMQHHLQAGGVGIVPTDTLYGLVALASYTSAVQKLYQLKDRPAQQPLQMLVSCAEMAAQYAIFSPEAQALAAAYWPGALTVIVPQKQNTPLCAELIQPVPTLGIRVPDHPELRRLIEQLGAPLAASSANRRAEEPASSPELLAEIFPDLPIMQGALPTHKRASTVLELHGDKPIAILREGAVSKAMIEATLKRLP